MFLLKDLPSPDSFERFESAYGAVDAKSVCLFLTLLRCGSDLLVALDELLARHGLSHGRWITLVLLMRETGLTARPMDLAKKQGVTRATMTGLLQSLERSGLVTRLPDPKDGRGARVKMTTDGRTLLDEIMPVYYARVRRLTEGLDETQIATAMTVLRHLLDRTETVSAPA